MASGTDGCTARFELSLLCLQISMLFTCSQVAENDDKLPYEEGSLITSLGQQT